MKNRIVILRLCFAMSRGGGSVEEVEDWTWGGSGGGRVWDEQDGDEDAKG